MTMAVREDTYLFAQDGPNHSSLGYDVNTWDLSYVLRASFISRVYARLGLGGTGRDVNWDEASQVLLICETPI